MKDLSRWLSEWGAILRRSGFADTLEYDLETTVCFFVFAGQTLNFVQRDKVFSFSYNQGYQSSTIKFFVTFNRTNDPLVLHDVDRFDNFQMKL